MLDAVPQYNGNISWAEWRVKGEQRHAYGFTYDSNDRLRKAKYATYDETCEMVEDDGYSVPLKDYDPLGNITMLQRKGLVKVLPPTTQNENPELIFDYIDKLSYNYSIGSNLLNNVTEGSNTQKGFKVSSSYGYDGTGNLKTDSGKGIMNVIYSFHDMPLHIVSTKGEVENWYDANGAKLKSRITDNTTNGGNGQTGINTVKTYHYIGGAEYKDSKIEAIYHAEGRYVYDNGYTSSGVSGASSQLPYHEYYLRDYLGNTRVRIADKDGDNKIKFDPDHPKEDEILGSYHYYPFGMPWDVYYDAGLENIYDWNGQTDTKNKYSYNGKEAVDEFGLDWQYYGMRMYIPAIGRFSTVDPISDKFPHVSTFNYAENGPINAIDLHGLQKLVTTKYNVQKIIQDDGKYTFETTQIGKSKVVDAGGDWSGYKQNSIFYYEGKEFLSQSEIEGWIEFRDAEIAQERRMVGEGTEIVGSFMKYSGYVISSFAPEVGVPLSQIGSGISTAGVAMQIAADISEKKYEDAAMNMVMEAGGSILSRKSSIFINKEFKEDAGSKAFLEFFKEVIVDVTKYGEKEKRKNDNEEQE